MKTQNTLSKFLIMVIIITSIGVIPTKKIMASSTTKNITAGTETISGSAYGSTDIIINSTQQVNIVIYKKGIFSSKKLKSVKNKKKYKYNIKKYSGKNKYIVKISLTNPNNVKVRPYICANVKCTIKSHTDKKRNHKGGVWEVNNNSALYYPNSIIYNKIVYFSPKNCLTAQAYIEDADYLENQSLLVNGVYSASCIALEFSGKAASILSAAFSTIQLFGMSVDFKKSAVNELHKKCGYNKKTKKYKYGACLKFYMSNGMSFIDISKWDGKEMKGAKGYNGKWTALE